jgi:hypothetical protein
LEELTTRIKEVTEIVDLSKKQMDTYTPEEIKEAESKHSEDYPSQ